MKRFFSLICAPLLFGSCSSDCPPIRPAECTGQAITPLQGQQSTIISFLEIGLPEQGFDLDGDGEPDNKLGAISSLARSAILDAFKDFALVLPIELFDFEQVGVDECVKFSVYIGAYKLDRDGDGNVTADDRGDCNDNDPAIKRGAEEIPDNYKDDDCDGNADEIIDMDGIEITSDNMEDMDQDGVTIADGDCDDTEPMVGGRIEICGDGLDNDCDGHADFGVDENQVAACSPYDDSPDLVAIDPLSFTPDGAPAISFKNGMVSERDGVLVLEAGPSIFSLNVPLTSDLSLDLRISNAIIEAEASMAGTGVSFQNGRLGGVIDANSADQIRGLEIGQIGLTPENSLLDAIFANVLGPLLALPQAPPNEVSNSCRTPDIDIDGDGLEAFCDSDPLDAENTVDVCIDGDGTIIRDELDAQGNTIHCTQATDAKGNLRFVDGVSVELNFTTVPVLLPDTLPPRS